MKYKQYQTETRSLVNPWFKGIISQLIGLYNGQTNFDLRLIILDLSIQKLLFTDVLRPPNYQNSYQNINVLYEYRERSAIYLVFDASTEL